MSILNIRLPQEVDERLAKEVSSTGKTRSTLAREAILTFLDAADKKRFLNEIVRAARLLSAEEARALAEESLLSDNDALEIAEEAADSGTPAKGKK